MEKRAAAPSWGPRCFASWSCRSGSPLGGGFPSWAPSLCIPSPVAKEAILGAEAVGCHRALGFSSGTPKGEGPGLLGPAQPHVLLASFLGLSHRNVPVARMPLTLPFEPDCQHQWPGGISGTVSEQGLVPPSRIQLQLPCRRSPTQTLLGPWPALPAWPCLVLLPPLEGCLGLGAPAVSLPHAWGHSLPPFLSGRARLEVGGPLIPRPRGTHQRPGGMCQAECRKDAIRTRLAVKSVSPSQASSRPQFHCFGRVANSRLSCGIISETGCVKARGPWSPSGRGRRSQWG